MNFWMRVGPIKLDVESLEYRENIRRRRQESDGYKFGYLKPLPLIRHIST